MIAGTVFAEPGVLNSDILREFYATLRVLVATETKYTYCAKLQRQKNTENFKCL